MENTPEEWDEVKRECDKIGYCCFTLEDQKLQNTNTSKEDFT